MHACRERPTLLRVSAQHEVGETDHPSFPGEPWFSVFLVPNVCFTWLVHSTYRGVLDAMIEIVYLLSFFAPLSVEGLSIMSSS